MGSTEAVRGAAVRARAGALVAAAALAVGGGVGLAGCGTSGPNTRPAATTGAGGGAGGRTAAAGGAGAAAAGGAGGGTVAAGGSGAGAGGGTAAAGGAGAAAAGGAGAVGGGAGAIATDPRVEAALARLAAGGRPVYCGGTGKPWVAFTFDDGPGVYTKLAVRILSAAHVPATFFLVGRNLAPFPSELAVEKPIAVFGDHTWTHPDLASLAPAAVLQQIASTKAAVARATGRPVQLFRPPYGARNATVDAAARRLGLVDVLWSADSADSLGADYAGIARNVLAGMRPGAIILMHENRGQTIRALKFDILPRLRRLHLRLVTVAQLLAQDPPTTAQLAQGVQGCGAAAALRGASG